MKKNLQKALNYLKAITAETVSNAGSGHTGTALGASSILFALFKDHYKFDVSDTDFLNRDRFVLSAGHASALYYTLLSMFGFDVSLQDLKNFRKYNAPTTGHPEFGSIGAVETTTGPLGQGVANAVGMAIAESFLEERFNAIGFPIINNYTYCFAGDGDLMEGVAQEACSIAGAYNLKKFIILYDSNDVTIDGHTNLASRENVAKKFKAMGFKVLFVKNGNSYSACTRAIAKAKKADKPCIIIFKTTIGIGTKQEGTSAMHAHPLSEEELKEFKEKLGVKESFFIPSDVRDLCMQSTIAGKLAHEKWNQDFAVYGTTHPDLYKKLVSFFDNKKIDFEKMFPNDKFENLSMRDINSLILNELSEKSPQIIGGTADLASSTKAYLKEGGDFVAGNKRGKNLHFGVREHAMGAICNGIALYEDFLPFDSTLLAFSNYMIPALRLRAMMNLPVLDIFTHDSVLIGEDGPTHQPIEQIGQLRSIRGLNVFRPCDSNELLAAYKFYLTERKPVSLVLAKQKIQPTGLSSFKNAGMGGYVLKSVSGKAKVVIYSTGSEIPLAVNVAKELDKLKIETSVVSMPCVSLFEEQSESYKSKVLQKDADLHVALEASNDAIWFKYLNEKDLKIEVNKYMFSANGELIYQKAGFTVKQIVKAILKKLKK